MVASLLLTWREGFEAAVIVSLVLAYLRRTGSHRHVGTVWWAVLSAAAVCAVAGTVLFRVAGEFEGRAEALFEGVVSIVAAAVITHVWRQGVNYRRKIEGRTATAVAAGGGAIFLAVFVAVMIEGLEIALFLLAKLDAGTTGLIGGGVIGLLLAAACGWAFYQTKRLRDAVLFFYALSALLIVIAAGLLAHGVHELQEAGVVPVLVADVWNVNEVPVIGEGAGLGAFLKSVIGYNGNPELLELMAWAAYLGVAAWYFDARGFVAKVWRALRGARREGLPALDGPGD